MHVLKASVLAVFVATLSACGGTSSADDSSGDAEGVVVGAVATCDQATGDRYTFSLEKTVLRSTSDGLAVTWTTSALMPTTGTVLYSVFASGAGESSLQLGVKYLDGAQIAYFVYDANSDQTNLDEMASAGATSVSALFPWSELDALGESFQWWSGLNVDGADVTSCPRPEDGGSQGTRAFP